MRTTPPRPVNVLDDFPELAPMARTALRLHPRVGLPKPTESSVGGPLLWPNDEPWPTCEEPHPWIAHPTSPTTERLRRRLLQQGWDRGRDADGRILSQDDEALLSAAADRDRAEVFTRPTPMIPIVQLYLRDAHGTVSAPDGADLLQIMWCPFDHEPEYMPTSVVRWRRSADVIEPLLVQPEPDMIGSAEYLPDPCVVHPELVTEFPAPHMLPDELHERIEEREEVWAESGVECYQYDLCVAPGWKIGGWGPWSFRDPIPMICPECGAEQQPLLYIDSGEWDGGSGSWIPYEDRDPDAWPHVHPSAGHQVQVTIGRGYGMQIYACPTSHAHPNIEFMQ